MKLMPALFAAIALTAAAGVAQADVRPDEIAGLQKAGTIGDLQKFNEQALKAHPGFIVDDTELEHKANGQYVYEIELRNNDTKKDWDYHVDAKTGAVLLDEEDL